MVNNTQTPKSSEKSLAVLLDMRAIETTRDKISYFGPLYLYDPATKRALKECWEGIKVSYSVISSHDEIDKIRAIINNGPTIPKIKQSHQLSEVQWTKVERIKTRMIELESKLDWDTLQKEDEIKRCFISLNGSIKYRTDY